MYQDRGMLKWQGFMLSEHTADIAYADHEAKKVEKPLLDEYQIEEYEQLITASLESNDYLRIEAWKNGFIDEIIIKVNYIDHHTKNLIGLDEYNQSHIISFQSIIDVQIYYR